LSGQLLASADSGGDDVVAERVTSFAQRFSDLRGAGVAGKVQFGDRLEAAVHMVDVETIPEVFA
jgi:hypothetical protein